MQPACMQYKTKALRNKLHLNVGNIFYKLNKNTTFKIKIYLPF